jgi:hypothetical protein
MNKTTKTLIGLTGLVALIGGCSAMADGGEAKVKKTEGSAVVVEETPKDDEPVVEEEAPEPDTTAELGDTVTIKDWDVKVTRVVKDADAIIANANMFNDKPRGQFVLVTYEATYHGKQRMGSPWIDLTWTLTGADHKVRDVATVVDPSDNQNWPEQTRAGGTVTDMVTFDVTGPVDKSMISVEDMWSGKWADFPLA